MTLPKQIVFEEQARELLLAGIKKLADVVACTLGPKGRNMGLEKAGAHPQSQTTETVSSKTSLLKMPTKTWEYRWRKKWLRR